VLRNLLVDVVHVGPLDGDGSSLSLAPEQNVIADQGSSINDVTVIGGGGEGFCNNSIKALVIKSVTMRGGGQIMS
jgi:hypothetical protein